MNSKIFRAKKSWIFQGLTLLFCGIVLASLVVGIIYPLPLLSVASGAVALGLLLSLASLAVWFLGPKKLHLGEVGIDDQGLTMRTFKEKELIRWGEIRSLKEIKTTTRLGGITFGSPWYWGPNELYIMEGEGDKKVGFSSETENYKELLETIVSRAGLGLVDTSLAHGGRLWVREDESYEKRPRMWFNWLAVFVILLFIIFGIYLIWRAAYPKV